MVQLDYYSDWYRIGPNIHKSVGVLLLVLTLARLAWRIGNTSPKLLGKKLENLVAHLAHGLLYGLLITVMVSGFLISTEDGSAISVFGWFSIPAIIYDVPGQAYVAGKVHEYAAWSLVILAVLHALAAIKHHLINKDRTLKRMLGL